MSKKLPVRMLVALAGTGLLPFGLLLCAGLLGLPATVAAQCTPAFTIQRVWTQATNGAVKTAFSPGETIQFAVEVSNMYGGSGATTLTIATSFYNDTKAITLPLGASTWTWGAAAPAIQGNYSVTISVLDNFCGMYVPRTASFTIGPSESPQPTSPGLSSCPSPVVSLSTISTSIGTKNTITGSGWVPGGTVGITLPYGSKALLSASSITPQVSSTGNWQIEMTVSQGTPIGEYIINFEEQTPDCKLGVYPTLTVEEKENPSSQGGAFGAITRCEGAAFIFPVPTFDKSGNTFIGWLYKEPSTDLSGLHSGLDFWVPRDTPVMAVATGYVSRPVEYKTLESAYAIDIYYPTLNVETYTDNLLSLKVHKDSAVSPGMIIGTAGSYLGHVHWSIGAKGYNDQSTDFTSSTEPHRDPTPYLTPNGNLNYASGAVENRSVPLSWWCTLH